MVWFLMGLALFLAAVVSFLVGVFVGAVGTLGEREAAERRSSAEFRRFLGNDRRLIEGEE